MSLSLGDPLALTDVAVSCGGVMGRTLTAVASAVPMPIGVSSSEV